MHNERIKQPGTALVREDNQGVMHENALPGLISVGQTDYVCVYSNAMWNDSGINVNVGQTYNIVVPAKEEWVGFGVRCGPNGYASTRTMRFLERFRRVSNRNWFQLIATVNRSRERPVVIASGLTTFTPITSGRLYFFSNGLPGIFWKSRGAIAIRVTRLS
jgi:hypothetical protein